MCKVCPKEALVFTLSQKRNSEICGLGNLDMFWFKAIIMWRLFEVLWGPGSESNNLDLMWVRHAGLWADFDYYYHYD